MTRTTPSAGRHPATGTPDDGTPVDGSPDDGSPDDGPPDEDDAPRRGPGPGVGAMRGPTPFGAGASSEKPREFRRSARRLAALLGGQRPALAAALVATLINVVLVALSPALLGHATDLVLNGVRHGQVDFGAVARVLAIVCVLYAVAAGCGIVQTRVTTTLVQTTSYRLRDEAQAKLATLPLRYFDRQPRGEILSRVTNDIDNITLTLQQTLGQLLTSLLTVVGVTAAMTVVSPVLAVVTLLAVPISAVTASRLGRVAQPHFTTQWASTGTLAGHVEQTFTGHDVVTLFGRADDVIETFEAHNATLTTATRRAQFVSGAIAPVITFVGNLDYVLIAVIGALRVTAGALTIGEVQAFVQYSRQFAQPLTQIAAMSSMWQSGVASAERVFALLDAPEQPVETPRGEVGPPRGRVVFDGVDFCYRPETPLIDAMSLTVEPGQTVAIVGPTGSGKTTIVNLLMRFYDVSGGRILIDDVDIAHLPRERVRSWMGMVLQDPWLFTGTIAENIAYGKPGATREQIEAAARATHVDHLVRSMPDGYDTIVDNDGTSLSSGEVQLITIARALLADPPILLLDEATSSVDTRTELLVQEAMTILRRGRTSFVIAHRLSTIHSADLILVLDGGRIREQGSHAALLRTGGVYAKLEAAHRGL